MCPSTSRCAQELHLTRALLPRKVDWNLTPSSSVKATTRTVLVKRPAASELGITKSLSCSGEAISFLASSNLDTTACLTAAIAVMMPSDPSYLNH